LAPAAQAPAALPDAAPSPEPDAAAPAGTAPATPPPADLAAAPEPAATAEAAGFPPPEAGLQVSRPNPRRGAQAATPVAAAPAAAPAAPQAEAPEPALRAAALEPAEPLVLPRPRPAKIPPRPKAAAPATSLRPAPAIQARAPGVGAVRPGSDPRPAGGAERGRLVAGNLTLLGVYGSAASPRALLLLPDGRVQRAGVGDQAAGWKVTSISADGVRVLSDGTTATLKLP
ncbi:MAG: hypothetical protein VYD87_14365, partial [Pseudomonadota bacterium]|nr:hypothetical protein [Pseudomonadota bacterium]